MSLVPPSDETLRAFDRGLLAPAEIDTVTGWLEAHPEAEERLRRLVGSDSDPAVEALRQPCVLAPELSALTAITSAAVQRVLVGSDAPPGATPEIPQRIRDYEVLRPLGQGGMGSVYLARHTRLQRDVALKFLLGQVASDPTYRARFEREMAVVGQLDHPHLIRAYDAGAEGEHLFLVMELLDGQDLARLVAQRGPLGLADACEVVRQAALGLDYAHEHGLVHRDVKPANLFLTRSGVVKVFDLGLARVTDGPASGGELSSQHTVLGTPDCMAPEQWVNAAVDRRADLYALGCTLFVLLTGRPPLEPDRPDSWASWMDAHRWQPPPELRQRLPDAPAELTQLAAALLAKDPKQRPASAGEVAQRLAPLAAGHALNQLLLSQGTDREIEAATPTYHLPPRRQFRTWWAALAVAAFVAALAVPSIWYFTQPRETPTNLPPGTLPGAAQSLLLTGQDHVELKDTAGMIDLNGAFTVEMWVKFGKGVQYFVGDESWLPVGWKRSVGQPGVKRTMGWVLRIYQGNRLNFRAAETTGEWFEASGPVLQFDDEWHHLAVSKDARVLRLFLDGKLQASANTSATTFVNCPSNLFIGVRANEGDNRVVNCSFRAFRVSREQLYDREFTPARELAKTNDTLVLLDFSVGGGRIVPDRSGKNHDGSITGGKWEMPPTTSARAAPSLFLSGKDHVELENSAGMIDLNGAFTVEMWVKFNKAVQYLAGDETWAGVGPPKITRPHGWVLRIEDGRMNITLAEEQKKDWVGFTGAPIAFDNHWHHLAVSKDAKVLRVFLDGASYLTIDTAKYRFVNCPLNLFLGPSNLQDPRAVNCAYRAFRVSDKQLYAAPFTPPPALDKTGDTLLLLDFSAGRGRVLRDLSGKGHDGLISGGRWED
jgi:serine/threonine protein kinase